VQRPPQARVYSYMGPIEEQTILITGATSGPLGHANHLQLPIITINGGYRFDRIDQEIEDDLLKLHTIADDVRQSWIQIEPELHSIFSHFNLDEC
jgi:hypothetical protein